MIVALAGQWPMLDGDASAVGWLVRIALALGVGVLAAVMFQGGCG